MGKEEGVRCSVLGKGGVIRWDRWERRDSEFREIKEFKEIKEALRLIGLMGVIGVIGTIRRGYHNPIFPILPIFPIFSMPLPTSISVQKLPQSAHRFLVRRVPSATLGKNATDG